MGTLNFIYQLNEVFGPPDRYLGKNGENVQLQDGRIVCSNNGAKYLNIAIENINSSLGVNNYSLQIYGDGHIH